MQACKTKAEKNPLSAKLLQHLPALCNQVRRVALEAGALTLEYFEEAGFQGANAKEDGSPVTIADQKAEELIEKALRDITPDILVIGEEAVSEGKAPQLEGEEYFWLVDPLDGTKEFISGQGEYTVNIALIKDKKPVLGVVYAPVKDELYAGCGQGSAIRYSEDTDKEKSIFVRKAPKEGLTVVASKSHGDENRLESYLSSYKVNKLIKCGSSLKICIIAAGKADLYPRFGPTCEWDIAAAHAVLQAAGGDIADIDGNEIVYGGHNSKFLNPEFIASSTNI